MSDLGCRDHSRIRYRGITDAHVIDGDFHIIPGLEYTRIITGVLIILIVDIDANTPRARAIRFKNALAVDGV